MNYSLLKKICLMATVPICLSASVAHAAEFETLSIKKQTSHYVDMKKPITRIAVGNKDIASVIQLPGSNTEFLIVTKANAGSTSLFVWTSDGARYEYNIVVSPEDPGQAMLIENAIGLPDVHVKMVGERILLTGTVENQYEKNYALQTARLFVNGGSESSLLVGSGFDMKLKTDSSQDASEGRDEDIELAKSEAKGAIIDLLQILHPTQIRLEAQIIEINSDSLKDLGIKYGEDAANNPGIFSVGETHDRTTTTERYVTYDSDGNPHVVSLDTGSNITPFRNNPLKWFNQRFGQINASIHALVTNGKAKVLSRPNVTTLSGEQATIQIGGEIPYSTTSSNGTNTNFKKYGIILQFRPVVDAQNRINSAVHAEVSNMSGQAVNGQPIITTRSADSVINLHSGAPIVIGGLMDSSESKKISKIPLLGDIPILGEFFKHTSRTRDKRELIIVVTPYLVDEEEMSQAPMSEPLKEWYDQQEQEREEMETHDFKEPEVEVEKDVFEETEPQDFQKPEKETKETKEEVLDNKELESDDDILEIKEPEPERILPPPNYSSNGKTTDKPFKK